MIPKRVVLENFLSFGSPETVIDFGSDDPLWVVSGPNGVGKSAVFDAITYCLFGRHRGGKKDFSNLVRHGANGFRVEFQFEFDGKDYRVVRNRIDRTVQSVETGDFSTQQWQSISGLDGSREIDTWLEGLLGLDFTAFTASVLLRQGQADAVLEATGAKRQELLKGIIRIDRFEELHGRIHESTKDQAGRLKNLRIQRDNETHVGEDEVEAALSSLRVANDKLDLAKSTCELAARRIPIVTQWAQQSEKQRQLQTRLTEADARASDQHSIRSQHARLTELATGLPTIREILRLRGQLLTNQSEHNRISAVRDLAQSQLGTLTNTRDETGLRALDHRALFTQATQHANRIRDEIGRESNYLSIADELGLLRTSLSQVPADLDASLECARNSFKVAEKSLQVSVTVKGEANGQLQTATNRQKEFDTVEVGIKCLRCGQQVTAEHAERERTEIAKEVKAIHSRIKEAKAEEARLSAEKESVRVQGELLAEKQRKRDEYQRIIDEKESLLERLGQSANAEELRQALTAKKLELQTQTDQARIEEQEAIKLEAKYKQLEGECHKSQMQLDGHNQNIQTLDQTIAGDEGQHQANFARLESTWQSQIEAIDSHRLQELDRELASLQSSNVATRFKELEGDAILRGEWSKQLEAVKTELNAIAPDCRISKEIAAEQHRDAKSSLAEAEGERDTCASNAESQRQAMLKLNALRKQIAEVELSHGRHARLAELLGNGPKGLQRELVRTAEREIVRHSNETVRNLSDGDLSIELDDEGKDDTFSLRIRRADDPTPIPVDYLSGSQKFRVAVSVALGIGRFAAGHTRKLESVIIDEGFGSLDRDGLNSMFEELSRLKQYLRRIILVSHQEDFADRFPVVYKLSKGDNGTLAEAIRR